MANVSRIRGLEAVGHLRAHPYNGRVRKYVYPVGETAPLGLGDPVKSGGTADATSGLPTIARAAAGDILRGVVVGVDPVDGIAIGSENFNRKHAPGTLTQFVYVNDDPDTIFAIQEDNSATFAVTMVGENADLITMVDCNTTTGYSKAQLSTTSHVTTTAQLRILGIVNTPDNAVSANAKLLVMINEHEFKSTAGV
jgi:hypothetical protein